MDSHTQMQILAPRKSGKRDAMDFSLRTPRKGSRCPSLLNFRRRLRIAPAVQPKHSHTSGGKASKTRAPTLRRKKKPRRARHSSSAKMHGSRRDVSLSGDASHSTDASPSSGASPTAGASRPSRDTWMSEDGKDKDVVTNARLDDDTPIPELPTTRTLGRRRQMAMPL